MHAVADTDGMAAAPGADEVAECKVCETVRPVAKLDVMGGVAWCKEAGECFNTFKIANGGGEATAEEMDDARRMRADTMLSAMIDVLAEHCVTVLDLTPEGI